MSDIKKKEKEEKKKKFYWPYEVGKKAAKFLSDYGDDVEFSDEFVDSVVKDNLKYENVYEGRNSYAEKCELLHTFVKLYHDKNEQKNKIAATVSSEDVHVVSYLVQAVNPRAHSNLGVELDIQLEDEVLKQYETTNTQINQNQLKILVLKLTDGVPLDKEVDTRFMWRMMGRSNDPLRLFKALDGNFRITLEQLAAKLNEEVRLHLGKKIVSSVPSEVWLVESKETVSASCFHNE
jgi:hypothetical protein